MTMCRHSSVVTLPFALALVIALVIALGAAPAALAQRFVPYHGFLEDAGAPVTGTRTMIFRLFSEPVAGGVALDEASVSVDVVAGVFSTAAGPFLAAAFDAPELHVEIEVDGVVLGRQELLPAPLASSAERGVIFGADEIAVAKQLALADGVFGSAPARLRHAPGELRISVGDAGDVVAVGRDDGSGSGFVAGARIRADGLLDSPQFDTTVAANDTSDVVSFTYRGGVALVTVSATARSATPNNTILCDVRADLGAAPDVVLGQLRIFAALADVNLALPTQTFVLHPTIFPQLQPGAPVELRVVPQNATNARMDPGKDRFNVTVVQLPFTSP